MSKESKDFIKFDAAIAAGFIVYYLISMGTFDERYSEGYEAVATFFLFLNLVGMALHLGLIWFDYSSNKMWNISLRGGCIAYFIGMLIIIIRLGIFSF